MTSVDDLRVKLDTAELKLQKLDNTKDKYLYKIEDLSKKLENAGYNLDLLDTYIWSTEPEDIYKLRTDLKWAKEDLKHCLSNIDKQQEIVNTYKERINKSINLENIVNNNIPKIFIEFLDNWKKRVYDYYINGIKDYINKISTIEKERVPYIPYNLSGDNNSGYYAYVSWKNRYDDIKDPIFDRLISEGPNREKYLDNLLEEEKKNKLFDLNNRVTKVVGTITDASNLYISSNGDINGVVIGELGSADVKTISAEGPIQRFHYRVLVHKINR